MALTHHPVRLFRLSCGCLRGYPMMPAGIQHTVLCIRCRTAVMTVFVYPERCCGARGDYDGLALSCTLAPADCDGRWHLDEVAYVKFTTEVPRLERSREGTTGRA